MKRMAGMEMRGGFPGEDYKLFNLRMKGVETTEWSCALMDPNKAISAAGWQKPCTIKVMRDSVTLHATCQLVKPVTFVELE